MYTSSNVLCIGLEDDATNSNLTMVMSFPSILNVSYEDGPQWY